MQSGQHHENKAAVKQMWVAFKSVCSAVRTPKTKKDLPKAMAALQQYMSEDTHRFHIHRWRAWGLLLSSLMDVVKSDVFAYLGITSDTPGAKRKAKAKKDLPKFAWWLYLRNEFDSAHKADGPTLHLDPNGRECVSQLFSFSLDAINHSGGGGSELDASARGTVGDIERAAWQSIALVVQYKVYCAVLDKNQLQEVLEFALAAIDHGATHHSSFPTSMKRAGSTDTGLLASVIHRVLVNSPYDLHDWLPMLVLFFSRWFEKLAPSTTSSTLVDIAPKMLEALTDVGKLYFTKIGPSLLQHGLPLLQYVKRMWKETAAHQRSKLAEFVTLYIAVFEYHADSVALQGDLDPVKLVKEAKALLAMVLEPKELHGVRLSPRVSVHAVVSGATTSSGSSGNPSGFGLDSATVSFFVCVADLIYFHDRLLQRIADARGQTNGDDDDDAMMTDLTASSPSKRSHEATTSAAMAWEQLLAQIVADPGESDDSAFSASSFGTPSSQFRERRLQHMQQQQARIQEKLLVIRMVVLLAVLRRHGAFYAHERIGDLMTVVKEVTQSLESKEFDQRQSVALHVLIQLALLSTSQPDLKSDLFEEYWRKTWDTLLRPDLPYTLDTSVFATRDSIGELVFMLLHCCISFGLVRRSVVASASTQLWRMYRPALSSSLSSSSSTSVPSPQTISSPLSVAPVAFLASLMQLVQPPSDVAPSPSQVDEVFSQDALLVVPNVRSQLLRVLFDHIQTSVLQEESQSNESTRSSQDTTPAAYAAALVGFLGVTPSAVLLDALHIQEHLQPTLLRNFSSTGHHVDDSQIDPELEGFGVHFTLIESGMDWVHKTHPYMRSTSHPDQFPPLVDLFRQTQTSLKQVTTGMNVDGDRSEGFTRLSILDDLAKRVTTASTADLLIKEKRMRATTKATCEIPVSASREALASSILQVTADFKSVLNDLSAKLCSAEPNSLRFLSLLTSTMSVGLTLSCMYAEAIELTTAHAKSGAKDIETLLCMLLKKFLTIFSDHFSTGLIDHARQSPKAASVVTQQLIHFHTFIVVMQGRRRLQHVNHPCADPLELRTPSELRPAVRKVTAAIEASLEILLLDDPASQLAQLPGSLHSVASRPLSSFGAISATPSSGTSWDWDSSSMAFTGTSQPRAARSTASTFDVDDDEDLVSSSRTSSSAKPTQGNSLAPKILSLWSLRVILLLKKEIGLKAVRKYALELEFPPDFLLATASLLCGVCGCESLEILVKILEKAYGEMAKGSLRGNSSTALSVIAGSEMLRVLRRCAFMHENRKHKFKEEIPELLLTTASRFLAATSGNPLTEQLAVVRRGDILTLETFFRLDADAFAHFSDAAMKNLVDIDFPVRFAAARSLQSLYYMYPDGCEQIFCDLYKVLSPCLPPMARVNPPSDEEQKVISQEELDAIGSMETCLTVLTAVFVSACSSVLVVPEALLVFMRLADTKTEHANALYTQSGILHEWLDAISIWYKYPSTARLVDDHFSFLWSHHLNSFTSTDGSSEANTITANVLLESFPVVHLLEAPHRLRAHGRRQRTTEVADVFKRHVNVILPSAVLYNVANHNGDEAVDDSSYHRFPLVEDLARVMLWNEARQTAATDDQARAHQVSGFVEEQLITDLFALSFVLHSSTAPPSPSSKEPSIIQDVAARMLVIAEDKATTHALSISHLGHVVMKMARFAVWDIAGTKQSSADDDLITESSSPSREADHWLRAMKTMKDKYSGFDWSRMNLAELLSEFHEMLLRTVYFEPLASRAIECFCLFVNEIKDAMTGTTSQAGVLQHLLLHVLFETVKNVKRRDKPSSRRLSFLVREMCDHLMTNCTDAFGKYLNFVVHEIAQLLVRANSRPRQDDDDNATHGTMAILDGDEKANLEWVIFAVCNNSATDLGKYMVDVDVVPSGVASCLDKLNSMLTTSGSGNRATGSDRRRSLDANAQATNRGAAGRDKPGRQALQQIEQFVHRANQVGERFFQPRTVVSGAIANTMSNDAASGSGAGADGANSKLSHLREQIRSLRAAAAQTSGQDGVNDVDAARTEQKAVLAKLTRTLFTLSTQYEKPIATQNNLVLAIADTLGEVGAWDPHDFELSPGQYGDELNHLYQRHFRRGALQETKAAFQLQMHEHLLQYLSSLLFESTASESCSGNGDGSTSPNAAVIYETLSSIKNVLRLDSGSSALSRCKDAELKSFLEPFMQAPPSNWSLAATPKTQVGSLSRLKSLWRTYDSVAFNEWISPLTEAMAARCADPILRACAPLARHRTDMAIFLFPYAVWTIVKTGHRDAKAATLVQNSIRSILSSSTTAGSVSNGRVVQLVIHCLNFLRETEKAVFVESNGQHAAANAKAFEDASNATARLNQPAYGCLVDVDLLDVAAAAVQAKMPYSAMQYVEMWLEKHHGGVMPGLSPAASSLTSSSSFSSLITTTTEADSRVRSILVDAYSFDDDVDGIYGVNDGRTFASQLVTYNREGNFTQALPLYDVALQFNNNSGSRTETVEGMLHSLNRLGYEHLLLRQLEALKGNDNHTSRIQEHRYELAWKSLQWNAVAITSAGAAASSQDSTILEEVLPPYLHQHTMHRALKALAHRDLDQLSQLTRLAKQQILESSRTSLFGLESTRESFTALLHLQSIHEIEACGRLVAQNNATTASATAAAELFDDWHKRHSIQTRSVFDATEALLSLEDVLVQLVALPSPGDVLAKIYLSLSSLSRRAGRVAVAYKALMKLEQLHTQGQLQFHDEVQWKMERAKLLWSQRETRSAIWVAKQVQSELHARLDEQDSTAMAGDTRLRMLYVSSLTITGKWIASQRSENSQVVLQDYLQRATHIVDKVDERELKATPSGMQDAAKAHLALAEYMAEMYHQVATRVSSREWLAGKRVAEARQNELAECLAMNPTKQLENRAHIHALNKEVQYDYEERTKVEASVDQFLSGALQSFGKGLTLSARSELAVVFRVISLWFSNQLKPTVNRVMQEIVESVPSYKFVPLSYQIISRVGSTPPPSSSSSSSSSQADIDGASIFECVLSFVVLRLCEQHPHHALIQLIALKNSGDVEGKGALEFRANVGDAKSESAKKYLDKLRKGPQRELLESLDVLSNAYIHLALFDTRDYHKQGKKIPLSEVKITTAHGGSVTFEQYLRDRSRRVAGSSSGSNRMVMPAVFTSTITPRPDMDYSSVSRVQSFDPKFSITDSGIHRPKIIFCHASDGRHFKQLVKGKDDTRQDLVIEQVFDTVNQFLTEEHNTRKRNLRLRTYKVVPLSPIAGVLEWVDNTIPWGSYLVGRTGKRLSAHERYHPHEWKHTDCRMYLKNATTKLDAYKLIETSFTPVFHHFFLEKYPDAAMWYKRRLAYVQSVAVTSIVGYILGIGDRHSQNILIHEETAELVHIDFGVVFDQGMALFTPETVPFRLTRELVDGMGVSGVEGVFTRCCEATLQLLRKKSASVVTILEVFVHDPLYRWTLSPLKALRIQEEGGGGTAGARSNGGTKGNSDTDDSSSIASSAAAAAAATGAHGAGSNDAAARALIRVKQKLEGYEDPNGNALSIEGQVKQLISAAQDPHNLCALFPGWAPWL